ncbi:hypothetical protein WICPIJ_009333 [Wickerhamomyces pijperi]|uniref:Uncharacterized protein n=1 Tax=Wickerhamomyces pijperi TaxID=599730 RepID=A0A9P8PP22_WICPI|nr:hypothetical protein WICPIJ_009333 [Wickerhamomyces pijperi]
MDSNNIDKPGEQKRAQGGQKHNRPNKRQTGEKNSANQHGVNESYTSGIKKDSGRNLNQKKKRKSQRKTEPTSLNRLAHDSGSPLDEGDTFKDKEDPPQAEELTLDEFKRRTYAAFAPDKPPNSNQTFYQSVSRPLHFVKVDPSIRSHAQMVNNSVSYRYSLDAKGWTNNTKMSKKNNTAAVLPFSSTSSYPSLRRSDPRPLKEEMNGNILLSLKVPGVVSFDFMRDHYVVDLGQRLRIPPAMPTVVVPQVRPQRVFCTVRISSHGSNRSILKLQPPRVGEYSCIEFYNHSRARFKRYDLHGAYLIPIGPYEYRSQSRQNLQDVLIQHRYHNVHQNQNQNQSQDPPLFLQSQAHLQVNQPQTQNQIQFPNRLAQDPNQFQEPLLMADQISSTGTYTSQTQNQLLQLPHQNWSLNQDQYQNQQLINGQPIGQGVMAGNVNGMPPYDIGLNRYNQISQPLITGNFQQTQFHFQQQLHDQSQVQNLNLQIGLQPQHQQQQQFNVRVSNPNEEAINKFLNMLRNSQPLDRSITSVHLGQYLQDPQPGHQNIAESNSFIQQMQNLNIDGQFAGGRGLSVLELGRRGYRGDEAMTDLSQDQEVQQLAQIQGSNGHYLQIEAGPIDDKINELEELNTDRKTRFKEIGNS